MVTDNGKWGALDAKGKIAIPVKYDQLTDFNSGYALAELKGKFFVVSKSGTETPVKASGIRAIKKFSEGLGIIEVNGELWGFVDADGKTAITPKYEGVGYFSGGLAWARLEGIIGFINPEGEWVIKPQFATVRDFGKKKGEVGFLNNKGEWAIAPQFDVVRDFKKGYAPVQVDNKWGLIDKTGKWVIKPAFPHMRDEPMMN